MFCLQLSNSIWHCFLVLAVVFSVVDFLFNFLVSFIVINTSSFFSKRKKKIPLPHVYSVFLLLEEMWKEFLNLAFTPTTIYIQNRVHTWHRRASAVQDSGEWYQNLCQVSEYNKVTNNNDIRNLYQKNKKMVKGYRHWMQV